VEVTSDGTFVEAGFKYAVSVLSAPTSDTQVTSPFLDSSDVAPSGRKFVFLTVQLANAAGDRPAHSFQ
jgi:hypothetical protein